MRKTIIFGLFFGACASTTKAEPKAAPAPVELVTMNEACEVIPRLCRQWCQEDGVQGACVPDREQMIVMYTR